MSEQQRLSPEALRMLWYWNAALNRLLYNLPDDALAALLRQILEQCAELERSGVLLPAHGAGEPAEGGVRR